MEDETLYFQYNFILNISAKWMSPFSNSGKYSKGKNTSLRDKPLEAIVLLITSTQQK